MSCKVGAVCSCGFKNTGMKYGPEWDKLHEFIDKHIGCEECNAHGHEEINGVRENIRVGIGKKPHDLEKYKKWVEEVNCVFNKCVEEGRCH